MKHEVFRDIKLLSTTEISHKYDLKIFDDGSILDIIEDKRFADLHEWATFIEEESQFQVPYKNVPIKSNKYWDED